MAANVTSMMSILANMRGPLGVDPVKVTLPSPPVLEGALAANDYLTMTQSYALNAISGPESMVIVNRYIYTGLKNGWIVEIQPSGHVRKILRMSVRSCDQPGAAEGSCGRPLGLRADSRGYLVVADAYNGIFRVHPGTGQFLRLVDGRNGVVNGRPIRYINDLAVAKDGSIYFTSSSTKWKPSQMLNIMFEGETSGRVLMYNPRETRVARRVQELVSNLHYPNGVQLSPDEKSLLIAEGGRCKIHRAWIHRGSPNFGKIETFADNLPGNVDNIRLSPRGTYWVALSRARHAGLPSVMDTYGDQPDVRENLITLVNNNMVFDDPKFGIVVELNSDGQIIRSLQDPTGSKYTSISEVGEEKGLLFIASKTKNFIGIIDLGHLPQPITSPANTGDTGLGLPVVTEEVNEQQLVSKVSQRLQAMSATKVRDIVLMLVQQLYKAKMEAKEANEEISRLRAQLEYLKHHSGGQVPGEGSGAIPAGGAGSTTTTALPQPVTDWPIGGGGGFGGGGIPATAAPVPQSTTTAMSPAASTTTAPDSDAVIPPDMGGSSALGSVDGGVPGGVSGGVPGGATPSGTTAGGLTTLTAQSSTTATSSYTSSSTQGTGTTTTEAGTTTTAFAGR